MTAEITNDMRLIVEDAIVSFVGTITPDGWPCISPKGSVRIYDDAHIAFMDIASPQTIENLRHDPRVEITSIDVFRRRGYRLRGEATILQPGHPVFEWLARWLLALNGPGYPANQAVLVEVSRIRPVLSPAYVWGNANEDDLVASYSQRYQQVVDNTSDAVTASPIADEQEGRA